jgi:hypothetical protein
MKKRHSQLTLATIGSAISNSNFTMQITDKRVPQYVPSRKLHKDKPALSNRTVEKLESVASDYLGAELSGELNASAVPREHLARAQRLAAQPLNNRVS